MQKTEINAYAKINLCLDVLRRRPDGYHEVRMVMQSIDLFDTLVLEQTEEPGIVLHSGIAGLPDNEDNLVYRAAKLFFQSCGIKPHIRITLTKRIPMAAGLAGGSSDAAAALTALNRLLKTGLSLAELQALGVKLGADVPYCLQLGTALSEGIGEKLTALPAAPPCSCLIVKPPVSVSTRYVYEHLSLDTVRHPDVDAQLAAIRSKSFDILCGTLGNVLESVTVPLHPEIAGIKQELLSLGASGALMSGSGPTVFGLFPDETSAGTAFEHFKNSRYKNSCHFTHFYNP